MRGKKFRTHYDNLKVARDAPPEVVRAAYKVLAQRYHPDRNPGSERAARIMQIVNASYQVLSDPKARAAHDAWIAEQERSQSGGAASAFAAESGDSIRAEPRRHTDARSAADASHASGSAAWIWLVGKVRAAVVTILIALAIGAVIKLPRALSRLEQANRMSSSSAEFQTQESRLASFTAEERQQAREQCNAEIALLKLFMRTTIAPEDERVPADVREAYWQTVQAGDSRFNEDVRAAAMMVWAQRDDLRTWKRVSVSQRVETCMEKQLSGQPRSLTDWLPVKPVRTTVN
jgi:curved DNA-binding protein CbpA